MDVSWQLSNLYGYEDSFLADVAEKIESWLKSMKFFLCSRWRQLIYAKPSYTCSGILEWMQIWGTVLLIAVIASHVEEDLMGSAKEG